MEIIVKRAESEADIAFIAAGFEETIALWEDYNTSVETITKRAESVREWLQNEKVLLEVATLPDGTPVGFNSLMIVSDYNGDLFGKIIILFVDPARRGQGIARQLKDSGEKWLRERGVQRVMTEIDVNNERMLAINTRAGFRVKSITMERDL